MKTLGLTCVLFLVVSVVCATSCRKATLAPTVRELATPAAGPSGEPELFAAADGQVILSWVERINDNRHALRFATLDGERWSQPLTVAEGDNWFVNWADFPSVVKLSDNSLAAHWLVKSAQAKYAYDVRLARSIDGGRTWGQPLTPHRDGTPTEHGFVSLVPFADGGALATVWLDGRKTGGAAQTREMTLRYATINHDGTLADEAELDGRVCDCCQTAAARTSDGLLVVYRDRSDTEVRDFAVVRRLTNGAWTTPRTLHADNWQTRACPVNGASVAAHNRRVVVAWYTAARDEPQVKVSFSEDSGATFSEPIRADDGAAQGRVDVVLLEDSALVCWLEGTAQGGKIKARRIGFDGERFAALTVADTSTGRASGFPRLVRFGSAVIFAWTEAGASPQVRTAAVNFARR